MKQRLGMVLIAATLFLTTVEAQAQFPISSALTLVQQITKQIGESIRTGITQANQLKTKQLEEATSGQSACSFELKIIPLKTVEYAKENMWMNKGDGATKSEITALIDKLAPPMDDYKKAKEFIQENWFAQEEDDGKTSGINIKTMGEVKQLRQAYLQAVSARTLADATRLRELIVEDTKSIKDTSVQPESGCNEVDDLFVQNIKLLALVEQQLIGTTLQLEALEMTVARDFLKETADDNDSKKSSQESGTTILDHLKI